MARTSLADRHARLAQRRARLELEENRLKDAARKAQTRQLIEAGGLLEKAGLLTLDPNALYGALLSLQSGAADADQVKTWAALGGRAFDREAKARDAGKEPLILTLPAAQTAEATARLRKAGFRWSKVLRPWEGLALHEEAQDLASELGGEVRRVDGAAPSQGAPSPARPCPRAHGPPSRPMVSRAAYDVARLAARSAFSSGRCGCSGSPGA